MSDALNFDHYPFRGPLPAGWATVALEVIAKECESGFPSGKHNSSARGIPHVRPMNISRQGNLDFTATKYVEEMSPKLLRERDVIFNNTNSPDLVGKTTVISSHQVLAFSNHMTRIALENDIDERYVAAQLHALWSFGYFRIRCVNHVNQASISSEPLLRTVPLQLAPKEEQVRIADALDELLSDVDAGVEALERAKVKLKLYRASVLKAAVAGGLTADWRVAHPEVEPAPTLLDRILKERRRLWEQKQLVKFQASGRTAPPNWKTKYEEPVAPDASKLSKLPEGWCWATLDQLSELITSGSRGWKEFYSRSGALFIRSQDIRTDAVDLARMAYVSPPPNSEGNRTAVKKSDVLITITGANVAKAALVDDDIGEAYVSQHVGLVRLVIPEIGHWLHQYATTPSGGRAFLLEAAYGAGKPGLNLDNLKTLPVPLPSEKEQAQIVALANEQLTTIVDVSNESIDKITAAGLLRQAVLRAAFTGNLIPQCPEDEPALALLERIAAERVERERVKRRKPKKQGITRKKRTS